MISWGIESGGYKEEKIRSLGRMIDIAKKIIFITTLLPWSHLSRDQKALNSF